MGSANGPVIKPRTTLFLFTLLERFTTCCNVVLSSSSASDADDKKEAGLEKPDVSKRPRLAIGFLPRVFSLENDTCVCPLPEPRGGCFPGILSS